MNNEIKEILEFKENADYKRLSCDEIKVLRDYITNLQQRIEYLERSNNRREDTIMGLRDEIVEYEDYKSRIEKADWWLKEMLKQAKSNETKAIISGTLELLLNGRSDE